MSDMDSLFDVFGAADEPTALPVKVTAKKPGEVSAVDLLKRRREEAKESHGEEAKKLKMGIVDELRWVIDCLGLFILLVFFVVLINHS